MNWPRVSWAISRRTWGRAGWPRFSLRVPCTETVISKGSSGLGACEADFVVQEGFLSISACLRFLMFKFHFPFWVLLFPESPSAWRCARWLIFRRL